MTCRPRGTATAYGPLPAQGRRISPFERRPFLALGQRGEDAVDQFFADVLGRSGVPLRVVRLVDDHRAHALGEIGPGQHAAGDAIFHAHIVGEAAELFALAQLAQRDLAGLRALAAQRGELLRRPFAVVCLEAAEDVLIAIRGEVFLDQRGILFQPR